MGVHSFASTPMSSLLNANLPSEDEEDDDFDPTAEKDKGDREDRVMDGLPKAKGRKRG